MPTATAKLKLNGQVLATTTTYETVEGNIYFPPETVTKTDMSESSTHTHCPWKGDASYYNISVDGGGSEVKDVAWYYPAPFDKAAHIKDFVAFCEYSFSPTSILDMG